MIKLEPFSNLEVIISQKSDGNFATEAQVKEFLAQDVNKPICYFHHQHQAHRFICDQINQNSSKKVWSDGAIAHKKNICLAMVVADCFPLVLAHPRKNIFSLVHAGWKPLVQNILELTIQDLKYKFKIDPQNLYAWIGPGIRACCYRFKQKPIQTGLKKWQTAINKTESEYELNLPQFIKTELKRLKLKSNKILDQNMCTCCDETMFSHYQASKNGEEDGRFIIAVHQK
jgi:hypothetical protein